MTDDAFESRLLRFEEAWRSEGPPEIADFLDDPPRLSSPERRRLLVELIAIDLEFRWRDGRRCPSSHERVVLEDYFARFPELTSLGPLPLDLIGEEYRVRRRWGDRPSHEDIMARFPAHREEIRAELLEIDRELEAESADPRPVARIALPEEQAAQDPSIRLLSHRDFLLRRLIGAGRIGKVYQAWLHDARCEIAVKFLRKTLLHEPRVVRRFIGEARTVARLRHPHIVGTQGLGRTPGGAYFIVMDLVDGPDLAQLGHTRPIAVGDTVRWTIEVCLALEHAHEIGIIHCDLKPANILLDASGAIRVTDFGLARSLVGPTPWAAEVEGTAPFMAPEQVSRCWGRIDQRTDVYGIGAVLFALLTGRPPHAGRRLPDILADVISASPVASPSTFRPDLPGPLDRICRKCLCKAPEGRYQAVREVRAMLTSLS
jgi:hypothetical protein